LLPGLFAASERGDRTLLLSEAGSFIFLCRVEDSGYTEFYFLEVELGARFNLYLYGLGPISPGTLRLCRYLLPLPYSFAERIRPSGKVDLYW
jgi:hypothetical protein